MGIETVGAILLSLTLVALAFFVVLHNPRAAVNRRFGLSALAIAGWIISISLALSASDPIQTIALGRLGFAFASSIPFALLWMFDAFSDSTLRPPVLRVLVPGASCAVFILLSFSPWIVAGAIPGPRKSAFVYGSAHKLFGIYFLFSFVLALYTLWKTTRSASGLRKLQLRYLLLGILLGGAGAITTNLVIPLLAHTSSYSAFGPYFSLLVVSFSAHAIIRYRLMDIRVVIKKGVVYVCAIILAGSIFLLLAETVKRVTGYERHTIPVFGALLMALTLAVIFQPIKARIQDSLNSYLYREVYDYQRIIREASRHLSTILELDPLLDYLTGVIETTFKVEHVTLYLRDPVLKAFKPTSPAPGHAWHHPAVSESLSEASPLAQSFLHATRPLVREEVARVPSSESMSAAAHALSRLGGEVAFPLLDDVTLAGLVVVGPKRSGDPYFAEDIDLLETLVNQAAGAMKNAQLYRQVVLFNEYVDNILSTMDSGVIAINPSGDITLFNPAAERLTGLRAAKLHGHHYSQLPPALTLPLRDALDAQRPRSQFETSLVLPDTITVPLVCSTAILSHRDSETHGALIVFSDLTRLKDLEREKRRAERLASFGALASGVAHEIKNPLVAIRTFAELLPERFTDTDFREDFSKVVIREITRIDDLVGRLRGIAAGSPAHIGAIDIRDPVRDTLALLRAQLEQTHTIVRYTSADSNLFVAVEEAQLKQLFLNLLLNSIEAIGSGGEIAVSISRKERLREQWIVVEVSDTGPGIPDQVRAHVFDPFFTTKPTGTGLGLAICRAIVDAHRGAIRAENRLDRPGTTILIEFPAASPLSRVPQESTTVHFSSDA